MLKETTQKRTIFVKVFEFSSIIDITFQTINRSSRPELVLLSGSLRSKTYQSVVQPQPKNSFHRDFFGSSNQTAFFLSRGKF